MLYYVQMKWNYQGRVSQDELWKLEATEGTHGLEGIYSGMVLLYKVVSQHRIIAIVEADSAEAIDRNSMFALPMREYLEFEAVWPLRSYEGFVAEVAAVAKGEPLPELGIPRTTREVAQAWFDRLGAGDFAAALSLVDDDVSWKNIPPVAGVSDLAPWLGSYQGLPAVRESFDVWAAHSKMLSFELMSLTVDADRAVGIVHEHAQCLANNNEYDLYVSTNLTIRDSKIKAWQVYWDISPLVAAYRNIQA